jgi:hypothetical protein
MTELFEKDSFDLVIEKAGLDSITTKETPDVPQLLKKIFHEIYAILKENGVMITISIKNRDFWHQNIYNYLLEAQMFKLIKQEVTVFTTEKNTTLMNMYFYYLKKI